MSDSAGIISRRRWRIEGPAVVVPPAAAGFLIDHVELARAHLAAVGRPVRQPGAEPAEVLAALFGAQALLQPEKGCGVAAETFGLRIRRPDRDQEERGDVSATSARSRVSVKRIRREGAL